MYEATVLFTMTLVQVVAPLLSAQPEFLMLCKRLSLASKEQSAVAVRKGCSVSEKVSLGMSLLLCLPL